MAAQAMQDDGGDDCCGGAAAAQQPRTSFGRLNDIGQTLSYQSTSEVYDLINNYIDELYTGSSNLDFIKTYLGPFPHTWETLATACMMCIFEKYPFELSDYDPTLHLYPGCMESTETKYIQVWNKLNNLITDEIFGYKEVALILSKYMIINNERRPGLFLHARSPISKIDPIIMRIHHHYDAILPTTLTEFHTFISSNYIEFNYSKLYLKICRMHMAVQTINRYWRLTTCHPEYAIAKKRLLQIYHS